MTKTEFHDFSAQTPKDPPHHAMSRAPARHEFTTLALGVACAAGVAALLWGLYVLG